MANWAIYSRRYREKHPEKIKRGYALYRENHSEKLRIKERARTVREREKREELARVDPEKYRQFMALRQERRKAREQKLKAQGRCVRHKDVSSITKNYCVQCTIKNALRARFARAVRDQVKTGSAVRDLQCTIPEFRMYIEALWEPGMSWKNHGVGRGMWHIDHRRPLASFDLNDPVQVKEACCFINLQPLWSEENQRKSDRWEQQL